MVVYKSNVSVAIKKGTPVPVSIFLLVYVFFFIKGGDGSRSYKTKKHQDIKAHPIGSTLVRSGPYSHKEKILATVLGQLSFSPFILFNIK